MSRTSGAPSIARNFLETAREHPDRVFLVGRDERAFTYREVASRARRFTTWLQREGVTPGDRVILTFPNSVDYLCAYLGTLLRGATAVLVDHDARPDHVDFVRRDVEASLWMSPEPREEYADVPEHRTFPPDLDARPEASFESLCPDAGGAPALILYTSGTTGTPKGVRLSHANLQHTIGAITEWARIRPGERELTILPLTHLFGLAHVHIHWTLGGTVIVDEGLGDVPRLLERLERHRATSFPGTPAGFKLILHGFGDRFREAAESLRYIIIDSAPMPEEDVRTLLDLVPHVRSYMYYGLTEASRSTYIHYNAHPDKLRTVGRPTPGAEIRVGSADEPLVGEEGEVLIRGPHVTEGYWGVDRKDHFTGDWLHTGDLGVMDEDGFLTWTGRLKEQINVDGRKVSPREVEDVLSRQPGVRECAVVGEEDPVTGQRVVGFVVPDGTNGDPSEGLALELRRACKPHLEFYKIPRAIRFVPSIPRTDTGKVKRLHLLETVER